MIIPNFALFIVLILAIETRRRLIITVEFKILVQQRTEENPYSGALWVTHASPQKNENASRSDWP